MKAERKTASPKRSPPLPREHGAWAVLYGPFVVAVVAAGRFGIPETILLLTVTAVFLAREPTAKLARASRHGVPGGLRRVASRWIAVCLATAAAGTAALVLPYDRPHLLTLGAAVLPVFAFHLYLTANRRDRGLGAEVLGVLALTATGPAAWYTATGRLGWEALLLWLLNVLYFLSAVFHVRMAISRFKQPREFAPNRLRSLAYHLFLAAALIWFVRAGWIPSLAAVAYLPVVGRTLLGMVHSPVRLDIKRVGYLEVAFTVFFVIVGSLALRLGEMGGAA
jgi:hypothetical protein